MKVRIGILVDACLLTQWAKSSPSITYEQSVGFLSSTLLINSSLFNSVFHQDYLLAGGMYFLQRSNSAETLLMNVRPLSFIWMPCLHIKTVKLLLPIFLELVLLQTFCWSNLCILQLNSNIYQPQESCIYLTNLIHHGYATKVFVLRILTVKKHPQLKL